MSILGPSLEAIKEAQDAYQQTLAAAVNEIKPALLGAMQCVPEKIVKFEWTQYTPYFNDGSACVFSINDVWPFTQGMVDEGLDEGIYLGGDYDSKWNDDIRELLTREEYETCVEIETFIRASSDLMEQAFGDHALIILTRDEIMIEEYNHD